MKRKINSKMVYTDGIENHTRGGWIERTMDEYGDIDPEIAADIVDNAIWIGDLYEL